MYMYKIIKKEFLIRRNYCSKTKSTLSNDQLVIDLVRDDTFWSVMPPAPHFREMISLK